MDAELVCVAAEGESILRLPRALARARGRGMA